MMCVHPIRSYLSIELQVAAARWSPNPQDGHPGAATPVFNLNDHENGGGAYGQW